MGYFGVDYSGLAQGQAMGFVNTALVLRLARNSTKYLYLLRDCEFLKKKSAP
jgi:hypothetical protein